MTTTSSTSTPAPSIDLTKITTSQLSGYALPFWRKSLILFVVSWMCLAATFSTTCLYPATEDIAAEFGTTSERINIANAGVLIAASCSSVIWVPLTVTFGRRITYNAAIIVLTIGSVLTALSKNMAMFTAMRVLAGFETTFQQVAGQTFIADVFDAKSRGTAVGFFMVGSVLGPALGPLSGGLLVSSASWRNIFWAQTGMVVIGLVLSLVFIPTIQQKEFEEAKPSFKIWWHAQVNMVKRMLTLLCYPNVLLADLACSLLGFEQYGFLASPRYLINPRFNLTGSLVSGLFYLSPGAGFILGSIAGGKYSDMVMARSIKARNGLKVPQDRLYSGLLAFFVIVPIATLVYGWCLEYNKGGLAVVIIAAFVIGFGVMFAFAPLNTYVAEVFPKERMAVISTKYFTQYTLGAAPGNAGIIPMIDSIGVGVTETIVTVLIILGGLCCLILTKYGAKMQAYTDAKLGKSTAVVEKIDEPPAQDDV